MRTVTVLIALMTVGCGPQVERLETGEEPTTDTGAASTGTTGSPVPPDPTTSAVTLDGVTSTGSPDPTTGTDDGFDGGSETGCSFTCPPPPPPPGGGTCNCPRGDKCMPWSFDGSETWTNIRCSPVADDPGQPGDPCTVEGNQWSGIDDCDYGVMCFGVDPKTNQGFCTPFCSWLGEGPCPDGSECMVQPGTLGLPLCVPSCDPTAPACPDGLGCFPAGASFTCQATGEMRVPVGSPCPEPDSCVAGALCGFGLDCGQAAGEGCCAEVCVVGDPNPCPGPAACEPWFGGVGAPEWSHVGYCV